MKKLFLFAATVIAVLLVSSCATMSNLYVSNSVSLSQGNFEIVKPISRTIEGTRFFGFFGGALKKTALEGVIADMQKDLGPNQALAYINIVESNQIPIIPIVVRETCTINATVIQFKKNSLSQH